MSIDGRFIKYLSQELDQELKQGRIQKISQVSNTDFLWTIRSQRDTAHLYLSLSTSHARVHLIDKPDQAYDAPGGFCMFLRKHIEGGLIQSIKQVNHDRIIQINISNINDLGDQANYNLIIELFGRYANLIILDQTDHVLNAYKHIHPFDQVDRTIVNGIKYQLPQDDKLNPEDEESIKDFFHKEDIDYRKMIHHIRGISPLFAKTVLKRAHYQQGQVFDAYTSLINQQVQPTLSLEGKSKFYYTDIFEGKKKHFDTLSALLNHYFQTYTSREKVKQIHKHLLQLTKSQINKSKHKLENLNKDLDKAKKYEQYRIKGDLIIQDQHKIKATDHEYTGFSYELNQELTVQLDRKLSIIDNAKKYYKRYKKFKNAIKHIHKQIILTKHQLNYFITLKQQITDNYQIDDLEEIKQELIDKHYLSKRNKQSKKKSKKPYNYDVYKLKDTIFYVGKNNLQNNYLTHQLAKKDDMWFHVQKQSGSHVIVRSNDLNEDVIRHAANLAAYHSKSRQSSSVPVDYTQVKHIKKIPGELGSLVSYTHQKTIYIDPDESMINSLKKQ